MCGTSLRLQGHTCTKSRGTNEDTTFPLAKDASWDEKQTHLEQLLGSEWKANFVL